MAGPRETDRVYRTAWLPLLGLAVIAFAPVGFCLALGSWGEAMDVGYGWILAIVSSGLLTYVFRLALFTCRLTEEGVVVADGIRRRTHPWDLVRSVRRGVGIHSLGHFLPLRLTYWEVVGRGGIIRFRVPNTLARKRALFHAIEDEARARRRRRIEAAREARGKPLGRDAVSARRDARWSVPEDRYEYGLVSHRLRVPTVPRELGIVLLFTVASAFIALVWGLWDELARRAHPK